MRTLLSLYAVSGFLALGYQVAWFRFFVDAFGSTNRTFAFVLVAFLGGLGAGSLASRAVADALARWVRVRDPLRQYGVVELAVAAAAAATLLVPALQGGVAGVFPYVQANGILEPAASVGWLLFGACIACVFVPCFLMGVTFPLLCSAWQHDGRFPAALYAANTLGAAAGVLTCELVLLPWLGHGAMHVAIVAANFALGAVFTAGLVRAAPPPAANAVAPAIAGAAPANDTAPAVLFVVAGTSGLLAGAFEADVLRRLQFFDCRTGAALSCVSFWAIVAIFAASAVVRRAGWLRLRHLQVAVGAACAVYVLAWQLGYPLRDFTNAADLARVRAALPPAPPGLAPEFVFFNFGYGYGALLVFSGLFVFPAFFLVSLLLPWACNTLQARGRHLGRLYGLNTLAFCAGLVLFTVGAPAVNQFYAMRLFLALFAATAIAFALLRAADRHLAWKGLGAAVVLALLALLTPAGFAASWFEPGSAAAQHPVRAMRSNGAHTTFVVAEPAGDVLWFDSHRMTGSNAVAQQYMRLMAHFPLLLHEQPKGALLICFGAGMTASAIAAHRTIERVDIVDLNDQVFATAPEFASTNKNVIADPRLRLVHDDGRHFLRATSGVYDLITSEPPPPMMPGVERLYSTEYYEEAKAHLTPGGLMSQWLPIDQMPLPAMRAAIASFVQVFPQCFLFTGANTNYVIVGCNGPLRVATVESRFAAEPAVRADLAPFRVHQPRDLFVRVTQTAPQLQREFGALAGVHDRHNVFAHAFHDPQNPPVLTFDPHGVLAGLDAFGGAQLACRAELARTMLHLGLLKSLVTDFPERALASVRSVATGPVTMADTDWHLVERRLEAYARAAAAGRRDDVVRQLEALFAVAPGYTGAVRELGVAQLQARAFAQALTAWQTVAAVDPDDVEAGAGVVLCLLELGRRDEGLAAAERLRGRFPSVAAAQRLYGDAMTSFERWADALAAYDAALRIDPRDAAATAGRARALQQLQR